MLKIFFVIFIFVLFADIAASFYCYHKAIARLKKVSFQGNEDLETTTAIPSEESRYEWFTTVTLHDLEIISVDGLKLHGYFIEAEHPRTRPQFLPMGMQIEARRWLRLRNFITVN